VYDSGDSETTEKEGAISTARNKFSRRNVLHDLSFLVVTSVEQQLHPSLTSMKLEKKDETRKQNKNLAKDVPTLIFLFIILSLTSWAATGLAS
jgi:hypothetical protein